MIIRQLDNGEYEITYERDGVVETDPVDIWLAKHTDEPTLQRFALVKLLDSTDYKIMKYMEDELSEEEYLLIKQKRRQWRTQINQLETEIESLNSNK